MDGETFTEWAERNGLALAPWQIRLAEQVVAAVEHGGFVEVVGGKRGGKLTVARALTDYWAEREETP